MVRGERGIGRNTVKERRRRPVVNEDGSVDVPGSLSIVDRLDNLDERIVRFTTHALTCKTNSSGELMLVRELQPLWEDVTMASNVAMCPLFPPLTAVQRDELDTVGLAGFDAATVFARSDSPLAGLLRRLCFVITPSATEGWRGTLPPACLAQVEAIRGAIRHERNALAADSSVAEVGPLTESHPHEDPVASDGAAAPQAATSIDRPEFRRIGSGWSVRYEGTSYVLRELVGFAYLRELFEHEGKAIDVQTLDRLGRSGAEIRSRENASETSDLSLLAGINSSPDRDALLNVKRRLEEISAELEKANANNDLGLQELLQSEKAKLLEYVGSNANRKQPRESNSPLESARSRVRAALKRALAEIAAHVPSLADHLNSALVHPYGNAPAYRPERPMDWSTR